VTLMVAAPAGIGEVAQVHAEQESGLRLRGVLRWPHDSMLRVHQGAQATFYRL
jgi:hypothetical protein